jgi:hypothetical protein
LESGARGGKSGEEGCMRRRRGSRIEEEEEKEEEGREVVVVSKDKETPSISTHWSIAALFVIMYEKERWLSSIRIYIGT